MDFNQALEILQEKADPENADRMIKKSKYKVGDRVIGLRQDSKAHGSAGVLVRTGVTVNDNSKGFGTFRNPFYVIKCDSDGKERKFQGITHEKKGLKEGAFDREDVETDHKSTGSGNYRIVASKTGATFGKFFIVGKDGQNKGGPFNTSDEAKAYMAKNFA